MEAWAHPAMGVVAVAAVELVAITEALTRHTLSLMTAGMRMSNMMLVGVPVYPCLMRSSSP